MAAPSRGLAILSLCLSFSASLCLAIAIVGLADYSFSFFFTYRRFLLLPFFSVWACQALAAFVAALETHGIGATPRVRRGIDIDAGCGQLSTRRKKHDEKEERRRAQQQSDPGAALPSAEEAAAAASAYAAAAADEASVELRRVAGVAMARGAQPSEAAVAGGW